MDKRAAQILAVNMMHEHGLRGWKFDWMSKKRTIGECFCGGRMIFLSTAFVPTMSEDDVRQVMLHEIAHALTPGHGHDKVWKAKARSLGYRGDTTAPHIKSAVQAPYVADCGHGHRHERHRVSDSMRPGQRICSPCKRAGRKIFLTWKHSGTGGLVFPPVKSTGNSVADMLIREAQRPTPAQPRRAAAYNGRGAFDKGFTDIESLFG